MLADELPAGDAPDTYGLLSRTVHSDETGFLNQLQVSEQDPGFIEAWCSVEEQGGTAVVSEPECFSLLAITDRILEALPGDAVLHAGLGIMA